MLIFLIFNPFALRTAKLYGVLAVLSAIELKDQNHIDALYESCKYQKASESTTMSALRGLLNKHQ